MLSASFCLLLHHHFLRISWKEAEGRGTRSAVRLSIFVELRIQWQLVFLGSIITNNSIHPDSIFSAFYILLQIKHITYFIASPSSNVFYYFFDLRVSHSYHSRITKILNRFSVTVKCFDKFRCPLHVTVLVQAVLFGGCL